MLQVARRLERLSPLPAWVVLAGVGAVTLGLSVWNTVREATTIGLGYGPIVAAAVSIALSSGVVYAGYQLCGDDLDAVESWTVVSSAVGAGLFTTLGYALTVAVRIAEGRPVAEPVFPLVVMATLGLLGGVVIGSWRVEIRQATESAEESRDAMAFTNSLLRHDVRNGLQVIDGRAQLLADHDDERVRETADVVSSQAESLDQLVAEVQSVTEVLTGDLGRETVDLAAILRDVAEGARESHPGVTVEDEVPGALPVGGADALYPVFRNLVDNAVTHAEADPLRVRVTAERDGDRVRVCVADNGRGVPPADRDRVFERGVSDGGSGHGLYVADVIVTRLGGEIRVEDSDLGGAALVVTLPADGGQPSPGDDSRPDEFDHSVDDR